jgi:hypothetical protein
LNPEDTQVEGEEATNRPMKLKWGKKPPVEWFSSTKSLSPALTFDNEADSIDASSLDPVTSEIE